MTVDERFEQLERKTQRLEQRNKRLTVAWSTSTTKQANPSPIWALTNTATEWSMLATEKAKGERFNLGHDKGEDQ